jgi:hypothetical protein
MGRTRRAALAMLVTLGAALPALGGTLPGAEAGLTHEALLRMNPALRVATLASIAQDATAGICASLAQIDDAGEAPDGVASFWDVRCEGRLAYRIVVPKRPEGSMSVLSCGRARDLAEDPCVAVGMGGAGRAVAAPPQTSLR